MRSRRDEFVVASARMGENALLHLWCNDLARAREINQLLLNVATQDEEEEIIAAALQRERRETAQKCIKLALVPSGWRGVQYQYADEIVTRIRREFGLAEGV